MYVKIWFDMGAKCSKWIYISHYEFRKVFGLEEPKELVIKRCDEEKGNFSKMPCKRIDDTWRKLQRFVGFGGQYYIVPDKIVCVFRQPCI